MLGTFVDFMCLIHKYPVLPFSRIFRVVAYIVLKIVATNYMYLASTRGSTLHFYVHTF